jgi:hypothetical protein
MKMKFKRTPPPGNVRCVGTTGQNIRGVITNKTGHIVQFESWAERALLLRLDRAPDISDYGSQPEQFKFVDSQGKQHSYTPDFIVWRKDGRIEIHEVTISKRRTHADIRQREAAAETICRSREWEYIVHTEHTLPQGSELANLLALFRYRPTAYADQAVSEAVHQRLFQRNPILLNSLVLEIEPALDRPRPVILAALGYLLWHGYLETDLNQLIFMPGWAGFAPGVQVWQNQKTEGGLENELTNP